MCVCVCVCACVCVCVCLCASVHMACFLHMFALNTINCNMFMFTIRMYPTIHFATVQNVLLANCVYITFTQTVYSDDH